MSGIDFNGDPMPRHRSQAMVLTGAGAYAAYEVGVMKALLSGMSPATNFEPLHPDAFVGSSVGAMNAAVMLSNAELGLTSAVQNLESIWLDQIAQGRNADGSPRCGNGVYRIRGLPFETLSRTCLQNQPVKAFTDFFRDSLAVMESSISMIGRAVQARGSVLGRLLGQFDISSLVTSEPFQESLKSIVSIDKIARSSIALRVFAMNFSTGKTRLFDNSDFRRLGYQPLLASTALPAFFPPHIVDGDPYIDGSTLMNTPLLPAVREFDSLYLVYMDPDIRNISLQRLQNLVDVLDRVQVVTFAYNMERDIREARMINRALSVVAAGPVEGQLSAEDLHAFLSTASQLYRRIQEGKPYGQRVIHRFHPQDDLGGSLGLMNIDVGKIQRLIDRGYEDAATHDCTESGCVIPDGYETNAQSKTPFHLQAV